MYGLIFDCVRCLLLEKFPDTWEQIVKKAKVPLEFENNVSYPDALLYEVVGAATKVLKLAADAILEAVGYYFIQYILSHHAETHGKILTSFGASFPETVRHINAFHSHLKKDYTSLAPPSIWLSHERPDSFQFNYVPGAANRVGLEPLVVGLVKGLAEVVFHLEEFEMHPITGTKASAWRVTWAFNDHDSESASESGRGAPVSQTLRARSLDKLQPFHICWEAKSGNILQTGHSLLKAVPTLATVNTFSEAYVLHNEVSATDMTEYSSRAIRTRMHEPWILRIKRSELTLKGQIIYDKSRFFFFGLPNVESVAAMKAFGLTFSDFPVGDHRYISDLQSGQRNIYPEIKEDKDKDSKEDSDSESDGVEEKGKGKSVLAGLFGSKLRNHKRDMLRLPSSKSKKDLTEAPKLQSRVIAELEVTLLLAPTTDAGFVFLETALGAFPPTHIVQATTLYYYQRQALVPLLHRFLTKAILQSDEDAEPLRRDSLATGLTTKYCQLLGTKWLTDTLSPFLTAADNLTEAKVELDPKIADKALAKNAENVEALVNLLLDSVILRLPLLPLPIRELMAFIFNQTGSSASPEHALTAVSLIFVLRFIGPAVVQPEVRLLIGTQITNRKALLLVQKILQSLSSKAGAASFPALSPQFFDKNSKRLRDLIMTIVNPDLARGMRSDRYSSRMDDYSATLGDEASFVENVLFPLKNLISSSMDKLQAEPACRPFVTRLTQAMLNEV